MPVKLIVFGDRSLRRALQQYVVYYHARKPISRSLITLVGINGFLVAGRGMPVRSPRYLLWSVQAPQTMRAHAIHAATLGESKATNVRSLAVLKPHLIASTAASTVIAAANSRTRAYGARLEPICLSGLLVFSGTFRA